MTDEAAISPGPADSTEREVFRRSAAAQVGGSLGAAIGALLFGGFAMVIFSGLLMSDLALRFVYGGMVAFFAVLMGASAVAAARRGSDTRVAELGPDGAWTPEMGFVAWRDLLEVTLEDVAGPGGPRNSRVRYRRRLGLVPAPGHRRPASAASLALRMTQAYLALIRVMAPRAIGGTAVLAPFGISETDLPHDFDRVVETARRYATVVEAAPAA